MKLLFLLLSLMARPNYKGQLPINDFSLMNVDGKEIGLSSYPQAKGFIIVFTCNHCPFAKLYSQRLNDLHLKYSSLNVPLLAINPMDTLVYEDESYAFMQERANNHHFLFPYLQDPSQEVGKLFNASHTPQVFVIWKINGEWQVRYKGPIDDNGSEPEKATAFVANIVDELLSGKNVDYTERKAFGCAIHYR